MLKIVIALPLFTFDNLKVLDISQPYLKILLSRKIKSGEVIRLKKGLYTTRSFVEHIKQEGGFSDYLEYLATHLYRPSYLSLEYVLYQHHLLTEVPINFTLISTHKTTVFRNRFGTFLYHSLKKSLFQGFTLDKRGGFLIPMATVGKALFDFLYLRQSILKDPRAIRELRLNLEEMTAADKRVFTKFVCEAGSQHLHTIAMNLFS